MKQRDRNSFTSCFTDGRKRGLDAWGVGDGAWVNWYSVRMEANTTMGEDMSELSFTLVVDVAGELSYEPREIFRLSAQNIIWTSCL